MKDKIEEYCLNYAITSIDKTITEKKITNKVDEINAKVGVIPIEYRVMGGILHSLNIQQGNFLQDILNFVINSQGKLGVVQICKDRYKEIHITANSQSLIENYFTISKMNGQVSGFDALLEQIVITENNPNLLKTIVATKDVDILFKNESGKYFYYELKSNDNHDSDKFVSLNKKVIYTYAGLVNLLNIKNSKDFKPGIFYFNGEARKNDFLPSDNLYTGERFFNEYIKDISYKEFSQIINKMQKNDYVCNKLNNLYSDIRDIKEKH